MHFLGAPISSGHSSSANTLCPACPHWGRIMPTATSSAGMGEGGEVHPHVLPLWVPDRASSLLQVFCDMETAGGGWTIIQRRKSGLVSFHRDWKQYKQGFGSIRGDFWLGNEHIHRLSRRPSRLRVELEVSRSPVPGPDQASTYSCKQVRGRQSYSYLLWACVLIMAVSLQVAGWLRKNRCFPIFQKSEAAGAQGEAGLRPEPRNPSQ